MKKMNLIKLLIVLVFALVFNYLTATNDNPNDDFASMLMFFPALSVAKESDPSGIATSLDLDLFSQRFRGGTIYMGVGSYTAVELAAIVGGMDDLATELAASYDNWEELADGADAIVFDSQVNKLKTRNRQVAGKRTTTVSLKLVGLNNTQKAYIESDRFCTVARTFIILADGSENDFGVLNGLVWTADWKTEGDGLNTVILTAVLGGPTANYISMYTDVDEVAS